MAEGDILLLDYNKTIPPDHFHTRSLPVNRTLLKRSRHSAWSVPNWCKTNYGTPESQQVGKQQVERSTPVPNPQPNSRPSLDSDGVGNAIMAAHYIPHTPFDLNHLVNAIDSAIMPSTSTGIPGSGLMEHYAIAGVQASLPGTTLPAANGTGCATGIGASAANFGQSNDAPTHVAEIKSIFAFLDLLNAALTASDIVVPGQQHPAFARQALLALPERVGISPLYGTTAKSQVSLTPRAVGLSPGHVVPPLDPADAAVRLDTQTHTQAKEVVYQNKRRKLATVLGRTMSAERSTKAFRCDEQGCDKVFKRFEHLKRHLSSVHSTERPFQCTILGCFKQFSRADNLNQHIRSHQGIKKKKKKSPRAGSRPLALDLGLLQGGHIPQQNVERSTQLCEPQQSLPQPLQQIALPAGFSAQQLLESDPRSMGTFTSGYFLP